MFADPPLAAPEHAALRRRRPPPGSRVPPPSMPRNKPAIARPDDTKAIPEGKPQPKRHFGPRIFGWTIGIALASCEPRGNCMATAHRRRGTNWRGACRPLPGAESCRGSSTASAPRRASRRAPRSRRWRRRPRSRAEALAAGHRLAYAGAGSSGLMALADALELAGTFGIPPDRTPVLFAGGAEALLAPGRRGRGRRRERRARRRRRRPRRGRRLIARLGQRHARPTRWPRPRRRGRAAPRSIGIANIAGSAAARGRADIAVLLDTGPELVAGSTRMGAATAQKIALNMISTLMGSGSAMCMTATWSISWPTTPSCAAAPRASSPPYRAPATDAARGARRRPAARSSPRSWSPPGRGDRRLRRAAARSQAAGETSRGRRSPSLQDAQSVTCQARTCHGSATGRH